MEGLAIENPVTESVKTSSFDPMDVNSTPDEENCKKEDLSLRITESDSDDEPLVPRVTKTYKKNQVVIDSDEEQLVIALPSEADQEGKNSDSEDEQLFGITFKPTRRIVHNDSDDDSNPANSSEGKSFSNKEGSASSSEDNLPLAKVEKSHRIKNMVMKYDESNKTNNYSKSDCKSTSEGPDWKSKLNSDLFSNGESSGNDEGYSLEEIKSKAKKIFKLTEDNSASGPKPEKSKRAKSKSATPKIAKEEIQKIHSESQRMVRETSVALPYHKPKQRSLTEFLNRKRVPTNPDRSLKPSLKDLDAVAQVLEDRAKEVEAFFKSDSEESETEEKTTPEPSAPVEAPESSETPAESKSDSSQPTIDEAVPSTSSQIVGETSSIVARETIPETEKQDESTEQAEKLKLIVEKPPEEIEITMISNKTADRVTEKSESYFDLSHSIVMDHKERLANLKRISIANVPKPSLHGRPGQFIDLDDGGDDSGSKAGVNSLIERFVEQVSSLKKSPRKKDVQLNIVKKVVSAEGRIELKKDVITVSVDEKNDTESTLSSGRRRQLVKDALRQSIAAKRAAERAKKQQELRIDNEEDGGGEAESEKEEEILSDEPETDEDELGDDEEEDDEDSISRKSKKLRKKKKKKKEKGMFLDEEADVSGEDDLMDGSDHEDDEEDTNDLPVIEEPNLDRCDEDDSLDDASTVVQRTNSGNSSEDKFGLSVATSSSVNNLSLSPNLDVKTSDPVRDAFSSIWQPGSSQENMDELIGLCSGRFGPGEGKPNEAGVSRSLFSQSQANDDDEDEDKGFMRILPAEDEDEDDARTKLSLNDETEGQVRAVAILSDDEDEKDRSNRKKTRLFISDDEEDGDELGGKTGRRRVEKDDDETEENDDDEMHEEEKEFRGIADFLDKEAELSGSELGSGDENEDGEDDWEEEDGDKEVFDESQVRDQLGRAHLKTMLDQDQREVRLFQELFLEDGDLHTDGGGRQRQFRWKDAGADEDSQRPALSHKEEDEDDDSAEVEQDSAWRKMRQEREKWLQEQKAKQEAVVVDESDPPLLKRNVRVVRVNSISKAAANQPPAKAEPAAGTNQQQKILSPKKPLANAMVKRGSFLRRSDKDLSTIASLTKSVLPVQTARTGSNFVFASLTPERPAAATTAGKTTENRKQKQMDSKDAVNPPAKKPKTSGASKSIFSFFQ